MAGHINIIGGDPECLFPYDLARHKSLNLKFVVCVKTSFAAAMLCFLTNHTKSRLGQYDRSGIFAKMSVDMAMSKKQTVLDVDSNDKESYSTGSQMIC